MEVIPNLIYRILAENFPMRLLAFKYNVTQEKENYIDVERIIHGCAKM